MLVLNEGRRHDARFPDESRPVFLNLDVVPAASGSAYLEFRDTKVICSVFGPRQNTRAGGTFSSEGQLRTEVQFASFADPSARRTKSLQDADAKQCAAAVQRALEGVVLLEAFPKSVVDVHILIVEGQGGETSAAITCTSAALAHAGIPMRDLVMGASVAHLEGQLLLDPSSHEERQAEALLSVAMTSAGNQVTQLTANGAWPPARLLQAMELCMDGTAQLDEIVRECLRAHSSLL